MSGSAKIRRKPEARAARQLEMGDLSQALGFRLRMLEQVIVRSFARHMEPLGVSPTLYSILVLVEANPECRQIDLSQSLNMHQPNLVERVSLLIERGLVVRREDPTDRRANVLELSFAGRHFMEKLRAAHEAHLRELREQLGAERYDTLIGLMPPLEG